jgi:hypothetical protein
MLMLPVGVLLVAVGILHVAAAIDVAPAVVAANTYIGGI